MGPNLQFPADFVTFTEEILKGKLLFFCSVCEICTKLKINTKERRPWRLSDDSDVPIVEFVNTG